jgi:hypothetical protein
MGILARLRLRAGRMPTPQENFEDFFIWKSLTPTSQVSNVGIDVKFKLRRSPCHIGKIIGMGNFPGNIPALFVLPS